MDKQDFNELSSLQSQVTAELANQKEMYDEIGRQFSAQLRSGKAAHHLLTERKKVLSEIEAYERRLELISKKRKGIITDNNNRLQEQAEIISEGLVKGLSDPLTKVLRKIPLIGDGLADNLNKKLTGKGGVIRNVQASFIKSRRAGAGMFKALGRAGVTAFSQIAAAVAATGIGAILIAVVAIVAAFAALAALALQNEKRVSQIRKEMGVTESRAREINSILSSDNKLREKQLETIKATSDAIGFQVKVTPSLVSDVNKLVREYKLSAEEAGKLLAFNMKMGETVDSFNAKMEKTLSIENAQNKVQVGRNEMTAEINNLSAGTLMMYKGQTVELFKQVAAAKRIGINFERARQVALGFLDIGSSLEAQFELEALTGQRFDLDQIRALALKSPAEAVEMAIAQFGPMLANADIIQQEAFAKASGLSFDELSKALEMQEIAAKGGQEQVAKKLEDLRTPQEKMKDAMIDVKDGIMKRIIPLLNTIGKLMHRISNFKIFGKKLNSDTMTGDEYDTMSTEAYKTDTEIEREKMWDQKAAEMVDDFILRPGMRPIKFNKDDLIVGGTGLMDKGQMNETNQLLKQLILAVERNGTVRLDGDKVNETLITRRVPEGLT